MYRVTTQAYRSETQGLFNLWFAIIQNKWNTHNCSMKEIKQIELVNETSIIIPFNS